VLPVCSLLYFSVLEPLFNDMEEERASGHVYALIVVEEDGDCFTVDLLVCAGEVEA
jgi:hypothetical protein